MDIQKLIENAIEEDLPSGDLTTECLGSTDFQGRAQLVAKEDLILSGKQFFETCVLQLDPKAKIQWLYKDGDALLAKQSVCTIDGNLIQVLKAERVALNFLGHFSGIATYAQLFSNEIKHTSSRILDTRKTTPGLRKYEKKAVRDGGAMNHRMSLSDKILIKENHVRLAGSMAAAIHKAREMHHGQSIEAEVTNLEEVKEAVEAGAHWLMLDNMSNDKIKLALQHIPEGIKTEASGNMSLDRVKSVAETGVDYISVGAITHSAPCADLSLLFDWSL